MRAAGFIAAGFMTAMWVVYVGDERGWPCWIQVVVTITLCVAVVVAVSAVTAVLR